MKYVKPKRHGRTIAVQAFAVTPTTITAAVPPLFSKTGLLTRGVVKVTVSQSTPHGVSQTTIYKHLTIVNLPRTGSPPGAITRQFLGAEQAAIASLSSAYQAIENVSPGLISSTPIQSQLAGSQLQLGALQAEVNQVAYNRVSVRLGTFDGHSVSLTPKSLAVSDRILSAVGAAGTAEALPAFGGARQFVGDGSVSDGLFSAIANASIGGFATVMAGAAAAAVAIGGGSLAATALVGFLVGGVILAGLAAIGAGASSNNVTAQLVGDTPQNMADFSTNSPSVDNSISQADNALSGLSPSQNGSALTNAQSDAQDVFQTTVGSSNSLAQTLNQRTPQVDQALGLNPDFGQGNGGSYGGGGQGGGTGSGGGGSNNGGNGISVIGTYDGLFTGEAYVVDKNYNLSTVAVSGQISVQIISSSSNVITGTITISNYDGTPISRNFSGQLDGTFLDITTPTQIAPSVQITGTYDGGTGSISGIYLEVGAFPGLWGALFTVILMIPVL